MEQTSYITIGLIIAGAAILLLAISKTHKIFRLVTFRKFRRNWRNLFVLMAFFFVGYLGVVYIVYAGMENLLLVLTGVIFFFGAVFVYLVVLAGAGTFEKLQEVNQGLQSKVSELKIQNEEMKQFNYATSHDLQEPLNTIITSLSILKENHEKQLEGPATKLIHYSVAAAERMIELIHSLSLYLKVGRDKQFRNTDLNVLAKEVVDEIQASIQSNEAQITISSLPTLYVNNPDIKRIFQNLISNSIKYRKPDVAPMINITAKKDDAQKNWLFQVEDNGIGISRDHTERVFQIFRQLHPKGKYEGMGIGLSICKKVVELHGGEMWLESEEGAGTSFYFTLKA